MVIPVAILDYKKDAKYMGFHKRPLMTKHLVVQLLSRNVVNVLRMGEREIFYLTMHSTHFIYGYMASDIWLRTILIVRTPHRLLLSINRKGSFICTIPDRIAHTTAFVTPGVLRMEKKMKMPLYIQCVCVSACVCACVCVCVYIYIYTYTYIHTHIYIYTYTHT